MYFRKNTILINELFTVKSHPALFEGEGQGRGEAKKLKHFYSSLQLAYTFKTKF